MSTDLKVQEEAERRQAVDPVRHWQQQQQAIAWAKAQIPLHRQKIHTQLKRAGEFKEVPA